MQGPWRKHPEDCERGIERGGPIPSQKPRYRGVADACSHGQCPLAQSSLAHRVAQPSTEITMEHSAGQRYVFHGSSVSRSALDRHRSRPSRDCGREAYRRHLAWHLTARLSASGYRKVPLPPRGLRSTRCGRFGQLDKRPIARKSGHRLRTKLDASWAGQFDPQGHLVESAPIPACQMTRPAAHPAHLDTGVPAGMLGGVRTTCP
jgi:hypothetical protein